MTEIFIECCCGLDVHQGALVVACVLRGVPYSPPRKQLQRSGTRPADVAALRQWLREAGCTAVAMESSGVYWTPVYAALEVDFELFVANPLRVKQCPAARARSRTARGGPGCGAQATCPQAASRLRPSAGGAHWCAFAATWSRARPASATG
jgi:transposase